MRGGRRAAGAAEAVREVPLDDLHRARRDRVQAGVEHAVELTQIAKGHARRRLGVGGELDRPAVQRAERSQVMGAAGLETERLGRADRLDAALRLDQQLATANREPERRPARAVGRAESGKERACLGHAGRVCQRGTRRLR